MIVIITVMLVMTNLTKSRMKKYMSDDIKMNRYRKTLISKMSRTMTDSEK